MNETLDDLQRRAVSLLSAIANDDRRLGDLREVAEILVDARGLITPKNSAVAGDWKGRTHEYRQWVNEAYTYAGLSFETREPIQKAVGYHVNSVLHDRFTPAQLAEFGFKKPEQTSREIRGEQREQERRDLYLINPRSDLTEQDLNDLTDLIRRLIRRLPPARREALLDEVSYGSLARAGVGIHSDPVTK